MLAEADTTPDQQPAGSTVAAETESIPAELQEIFLEESDDIIRQLQQLLPADGMGLPSAEQLREIRRHFHTFKGNGRAVGAHRLADLGAAVQDMLDRVLEGELSLDPALQSLLRDVIQALPELVAGAGLDVADIAALQLRCQQACRGAGASASAATDDSYTAASDPPVWHR
ncbi:Hpt domain-containing protein [Kineobactrum salinum]|uniref:HPt domain-containing protein n=1 Tax=Kineobactrum salinum TaxID=2708301 RepID=A0A6C0U5G6_9GAMM|nr:Hpt domain-containing protein [Kineobactrum salinum]QIB65645.1 hypothetical protein G3T16_09720 [Kineobactrum salinum]